MARPAAILLSYVMCSSLPAAAAPALACCRAACSPRSPARPAVPTVPAAVRSVDHHTQVKVKRRGSDTKYVAQVLAMGTECDIALLTGVALGLEWAPPAAFQASSSFRALFHAGASAQFRAACPASCLACNPSCSGGRELLGGSGAGALWRPAAPAGQRHRHRVGGLCFSPAVVLPLWACTVVWLHPTVCAPRPGMPPPLPDVCPSSSTHAACNHPSCSYPIGGDTMSVTSGVVSRIEVTGYAHGAAELLGIQVGRLDQFAGDHLGAAGWLQEACTAAALAWSSMAGSRQLHAFKHGHHSDVQLVRRSTQPSTAATAAAPPSTTAVRACMNAAKGGLPLQCSAHRLPPAAATAFPVGQAEPIL